MAKKVTLFLLAFIVVTTVFFASGCFHEKVADKKNGKEQGLEEKLDKANKTISELKKKVAENASTGSENEQASADTESATVSRNFGYIKKVSTRGATTSLTIDYAQLFTGAAATRAARADGEPVDMDFYIRNKNTRLRTFKIDPAVQITVQTYNMASSGQVGDRSLSLATFKSIFQTRPSNNENMVVNPYWITLKGSTVTKIKEQYLP